MNLKFLGASETVTGSKTILEVGDKRVLVDCGMFQGNVKLEEKNIKNLNELLGPIDIVFLTHAHLDHCGLLPKLIHEGYHGKIYCTEATKKLVRIILEDSVRIQEYEIKERVRQEFLYDQEDIERTLEKISIVEFGKSYEIEGLKVEILEAGHILGAMSIVIEYDGIRIGFSGDLGRENDLLHRPPSIPKSLDYLVIESTYGDRLHDRKNPYSELIFSIKKIKETGGVLLIPAFAVARTQMIVQMLGQLFEMSPKLRLPVYVDSPMGVRATKVYQEYEGLLKIPRKEFEDKLRVAKFVEYGNDLKKLTKQKPPFILISSSGMISGGKILKYFDMYAHHQKNTILLTGFQGEGTIGRKLEQGIREIQMFGHLLKITANVHKITSLSAHADRDDLVTYIKKCQVKNKVFINHGEKESSLNFKNYLADLGISSIASEFAVEYQLN